MTVSYSGNFLRLLLRWKGSIWRSVWIELVLFLALYYCIRAFYYYGIPALDESGELGYKEKLLSLSKLFNEYTKNIPLTFLLGFYVANIVSRWWSQFECLSWPEDLLSVVCMMFHDNTDSSKKKRHQIARYLNLVAALAWRDISDKIRLRFPSTHNLVDAGLMNEQEYERLEKMEGPAPGVRWMAPLHWIQQIVSIEVEAGRVPTHFMAVFMNELKLYRVSFRKLFCHDWVCVPLVYTQVASLATYAFFVFCLLGRQNFESNEEYDTVFPLFTIVQFIFYVGWFKVGQDLMRPFGLDDDDIELSYILDRNLVISFATVDCLQSDKPPDFEPDVYWQHLDNVSLYKETSSLKFGRIDLSRTAHKHPPKLHTYVQVHDHEKAMNLEEFSGGGRQRYIAW
ncbi:unnamed protein product [Cylicocyclus nassatus]|uniref:Bestrophin homolog n=1 Tax=Cylicocyclus nassatus TaxID=53992 RepID=A0AA36H2T1_CYLNA|nr:unnamed protein product [Cylicocyclus nassatus]